MRVPGTGIFMTARPEGAPPILVHHLTHNKVLHEHVVLLTVSIVDVPTVDPTTAITVDRLANGFWRVVAKFGFMEAPDVPVGARARPHARPELAAGRYDLLPGLLTLFTHDTVASA